MGRSITDQSFAGKNFGAVALILLSMALALALFSCMLGSSTDTDNARGSTDTDNALANAAFDTIQVIPAESLSLTVRGNFDAEIGDTSSLFTIVVEAPEQPATQTEIYFVEQHDQVFHPDSVVFTYKDAVRASKVFEFQGGLLANVEDSSGAPLNGVLVKIAAADTFIQDTAAFLEDTATSAVSDSNGMVTLENLQPGRYLATGFLPGSRTPAFFYPVTIDNSKPALVRMRSQAVKPFTGAVTRQSGHDLDSIKIFLKGTPFHALTNTNGRFDMGILPVNLPAVGFQLSLKHFPQPHAADPPQDTNTSGKFPLTNPPQDSSSQGKSQQPDTSRQDEKPALSGCAFKRFNNGIAEQTDIKISETASEPVFTILDLDPACAQ